MELVRKLSPRIRLVGESAGAHRVVELFIVYDEFA